jgi:hypothetical protein
VRHGDLLEFHKVVEAYAAVFKADETYTLIQRCASSCLLACWVACPLAVSADPRSP